MSGRRRFVFDTNVLVSALMFSQSKPRLAWNRAREAGVILSSDDTLQELTSVLRRPKLVAYVSPSESAVFLERLAHVIEFVPITQRVELCRDPRDDKFLELALAGRADPLTDGRCRPFGAPPVPRDGDPDADGVSRPRLASSPPRAGADGCERWGP
jgi:putative PIN family toxin of toxin-antitoxin system